MREKNLVNLVKPLYAKKDKMHNFSYIFSHILRIKKNLLMLRTSFEGLNMQRLNFILYFHGLKKLVDENKQ